MASSNYNKLVVITLAVVFLGSCSSSSAQLSHNFYIKSCPRVFDIVRDVVVKAIKKDPRMGASLLRMHFHDCFVNGCDASILLDGSTGEKGARPNNNSVRGYEIVDEIKSAVENECLGVVSCADILAIAAMKSVITLRGGFGWNVKLGRRDSKTASLAAANIGIPGPNMNLASLTSSFSQLGLSVRDLVVLSGAHSIGQARCVVFRDRIYNETNIDNAFAKSAQKGCPVSSGDDNLEPLDMTPEKFDTQYFKDLMNYQGLLHSDQQLFSGRSTDEDSADWFVNKYSNDPYTFITDFGTSMLKMGDIKPLTGDQGQIRKNCRRAN